MAQRPLQLATPRQIRASLAKVANEVRAGKLDPSRANSITGTCNVILSSLRIDEQEKKIQELENLLNGKGD